MTALARTTVGVGRLRQEAVFRAGVFGRRPSVPTSFSELEARAKRVMSERAWAYVSGGAGEGATMRANRATFDDWRIVPRMLVGSEQGSMATTLLGQNLTAPVLLAPIGAAGLIRPDADILIAQAAASIGLPYILSNQGSSAMEDVARVIGDGPRWFQLYWSRDEGLVESLIHRAENTGAQAIVLTVDTTVLGWRPSDLNLGSLPFSEGIGIAQYTSDSRFLELVRQRMTAGQSPAVGRPTLSAVRTLLKIVRRHPGRFLDNVRSGVPRAAVETFLDVYSNPALSWAHLRTLRRRTTLPIVLKGILHPDDARHAVDEGVDAIIVSNHGGRQVDGSIASLDALVAIRAVLGGDFPLILDSGIRSGTDVFKALALGAQAVTLGRPYLYGLALAGGRGVEEVLTNVLAELDLTLALAGVGGITEMRTGHLAHRRWANDPIRGGASWPTSSMPS